MSRGSRLIPTIAVFVLLIPRLATTQPFSEQITLDGSSTVFPVSEAIADEFQLAYPAIRVIVGISGTRAGFEKLLSGAVDVINASRPITRAEDDDARRRGIGYFELPVALDGITIVVNPANDWIDRLTMTELRRLWRPNAAVSQWSDLRPEWPRRPISLYGPGRDSGTYESFSRRVLGEGQESRSDYTASENDDLLVQGIGTDPDALGYFGYGYYRKNRARIKPVPIEAGNGPVLPTRDTITSGEYAPLVRLLFLYVRADAAERAAVRDFVHFYLRHAAAIVPEAGYVPLPPRAYELCQQRFDRHRLGSTFTEQTLSREDVVTVLEKDSGRSAGRGH